MLVFSSVFKAQDTLSYSKMSSEQFTSWNKTESDWKQKEYIPFLKMFKIKLNCGTCTSIQSHLIIKRVSGKTEVTILSQRICGDQNVTKKWKELKRRIEKIQLSELFEGQVLKVQLGSALKC